MPGKLTHNSSIDVLDGLLAYDAQDRVVWPSLGLNNLLRCALQSRLLQQLRFRSFEERRAVERLLASAHPAIRTFGDLLHHSEPPVELLLAAKEFAKASFRAPGSPIPPDIASLLYYGTIVQALVRRGRWITSLRPDELREALTVVLRQPWVDVRTRELIALGLDQLRRGRGAWRGK